MLQRIVSRMLVVVAMLFAFVTVTMPVAYAASTDAKDAAGKGIEAVGGGGATSDDLPKLVQNIINVLLFIAGAVAVVVIIIGGLRYITSSGDQGSIKAAKDTILYAVIGLIVALLAFAIVRFVVDKL